MKVKLYTTPTCGFCSAAKRLLDDHGVPYEEVDVSDRSARAEVRREYGWPTVPVVLVEGKLVGGYSELASYAQRRGLDHLQ